MKTQFTLECRVLLASLPPMTGDAARLGFRLSQAVDLLESAQTPILDHIRKVESDHFRTVTDTGSNANARVIWNALRRSVGLERISLNDLPYYDHKAKAYVMPPKSNLLTRAE